MIGWVILGVILLILAVVLLTPVQALVSYDKDGLAVRVCYGLLNVQLYPLKKAGENKTIKKKKPEKKEAGQKKKPGVKINREQIFYSLEKLPPVLTKALKRVGRRLTISPLRVYLLIAGTDPADTARLYGRLTAALSNGLPVLQRTVRVREQDIRLYPDFAGERMECAVSAGVSIRPWDVLVIGACAGAGLVKWMLGFRKLASPPSKKDSESENAGGQKETTGEAA